MDWTGLFVTILLFIAAAFAVASMQAAWLRRRTPGARSFSWMMLSAALWIFGAAFEYSTDIYSLKIFWAKFQYLGIATLPFFWALFAIDYSQIAQSPWLRYVRPIFKLFGLVPLLIILLTLTNESHGLIWSSVDIVSAAPKLLVEYQHGPWFWVLVIYNYTLLLLGNVSLGYSIARFPDRYRRQSAALIIGAIIPWVSNLLYLVGFRLAPGLDLTPVAFVIAGVIYSLQVFRLHLLDLVPVAQDTVVESMHDGVVIVDENGVIAFINPAGRALLDPSGSSLDPIGTTLPNWQIISRRMKQSAAPRGSPFTTEILLGDYPTRRIEIQISPLISVQMTGQLVLLRNVTPLHLTEEQLRLQSVALNAAPNAIMITDNSGIILWANPAFTTLTGYTLDEAQGNTPRMLKSDKHNQDFYQDLWEKILSGQNWHGEIVNRRKDGNIYIEDSTIAPVKNSLGEITHFIAIKQDITARKELEKMRDDLMQAIVHDLRNPLNSILFSLDMVQRLPPIDQVPVEVLSTIEISRENAWRMLGMINSILDLSRLESGSLPLVRENAVLTELVEQTIHAQAMIAQRHEVLVLNDVPYDLPLVSVDRLLISRVLQNLLDNAIKFANPGSNVEIGAYFDPAINQIIVTVQNEGPEIPVELQTALFQKFVTGPTPRRGSGLGLAFCRLAVEAHGGKIWVESQSEQGTKFFFGLPVHSEPPIEIEPNIEDKILTTSSRR